MGPHLVCANMLPDPLGCLRSGAWSSMCCAHTSFASLPLNVFDRMAAWGQAKHSIHATLVNGCGPTSTAATLRFIILVLLVVHTQQWPPCPSGRCESISGSESVLLVCVCVLHHVGTAPGFGEGITCRCCSAGW